jgi:hypothetical protein
MPQSLFKAYENRLLVTRVYVNDTIWQQTGLGEGGREKVVAPDTPQDLARRARSDPRGEQRSRRTVNRAIAAKVSMTPTMALQVTVCRPAEILAVTDLLTLRCD